jgi:hypothetical protein
MADAAGPSNKTSSDNDKPIARSRTLNETLIAAYPNDFVIQHIFAPAARSPRHIFKYVSSQGAAQRMVYET